MTFSGLGFICNSDSGRCRLIVQFHDDISQQGPDAFVLSGVDTDGVFNGGMNRAGTGRSAVDVAVQ